MAVIQKLRGSGVVVIVIIAALLIFAIGDILNSSNRMSSKGSDMSVLGEVFDEPITVQEKNALYEQKIKEYQRDPNFQPTMEFFQGLFNGSNGRPGLWDELVEAKTIGQFIKKAGLKFTENDLAYQLYGEHPYSQMGQIPDFQTNGVFDGRKVQDYYKKAKSDANLKSFFNSMINAIKQDVPKNRYFTYISKGWFTPKSVDQYKYAATVQGNYGKMVVLPTSNIADKDVKVTDKDLQEYIDQYKERYKQQESRDVQFVLKNIIPSAKDTADAVKEAQAFVASMSKKAKTDTSAGKYVAKVKLHSPEITKDSNVAKVLQRLSSAPVGDVIGPVFDGKSTYWVMRKISEKKDTANAFAKVRHILIMTSDLTKNKKPIKDSVEALAFAQELLGRVQKGEPMDKLARDFSADQGSAANGGVYDWTDVNQWVPEFKKFALTHSKGERGIVKTSYGYHVMQMEENPDNMDVSFVFEQTELAAGTETTKAVQVVMDRIYNAAVDGNSDKFEKAIQKEGNTDAEVKIRIGQQIQTNNLFIPGIDNKEMVRTIFMWLFDDKRKEGDINRFNNDKMSIVMRVDVAREEGYAKPKDVRAKLEPVVRNILKARKLKEKFETALKSNKTMDALAKALGTNVVDLNKVAQNGSGFTLNREYTILGVICGIETGKMSKPIEGDQNVAVVLVDKRDNVDLAQANVSKAMNQMDFYFSNIQFLPRLMDGPIKKLANLKDYRYKQDNSPQGWIW